MTQITSQHVGGAATGEPDASPNAPKSLSSFATSRNRSRSGRAFDRCQTGEPDTPSSLVITVARSAPVLYHGVRTEVN